MSLTRFSNLKTEFFSAVSHVPKEKKEDFFDPVRDGGEGKPFRIRGRRLGKSKKGKSNPFTIQGGVT